MHDDSTKKIVLGAVIGGIVGIGAAALYAATRSSSSFGSVGKALRHVGDIVEKGRKKGECFAEDVEKKINKEEDLIVTVVEIASAGLHLWNKLKRG